MATPDRPRKRPARPSAAPRVRRKTVAEPATRTDSVNVGSLEGGLSLAAGVLMIVAALFPRSIKQLLMLGLGGGLLYRGLSRRCGVYQALGIDTTRDSLLS